MYAKTTFLALGLAIVASFANAQSESSYTQTASTSTSAASYPGGLYWSNGTAIIYYDLKTGQEANLTGHLKGVVIKPYLFDVSRDGQWASWKQGSKFWAMQLPKGTPYPIKYKNEFVIGLEQESIKKCGKPGEEFYFEWPNPQVSRFSLSPDGARFSFEAVCPKPYWGLWQLEWHKGESYTGSFVLSTVYNKNDYGDGCKIQDPPFGLDGPIFSVDATQRVPILVSQKSYYWDTYGASLDMHKSACFLTYSSLQQWQKGIKLVYFIYRTAKGWGPIEIRTVDSPVYRNDADRFADRPEGWSVDFAGIKPRAWEIPVLLPDCQGLATLPNGSLCVQSQKKIYLIDFSDIQEGMKSAIVEGKPWQFDKQIWVTHKNNFFRVKSTALSKEVEGSCLNWVADDAFIFLGKDNQVYLQKQQEGAEKIYCNAKDYICYSAASPFDSNTAAGHGVSTDVSKVSAGYLQTAWSDNYTGKKVKDLSIWAANIGHQRQLEFCLTNKTNFQDIGDLSQYEWQKIPKAEANFYDRGNTQHNDSCWIRVSLGKVLLMREQGGNTCALVNPKEIIRSWTSWDKVPQEVRDSCIASNKDHYSKEEILKRPPQYFLGMMGCQLRCEWENRPISGPTKPAVAAKTVNRNIYNPGEQKVTVTSKDGGNTSSQLFKIREDTKFSVGGVMGFQWQNVALATERGNHYATVSVPANSFTTGYYQAKQLPGKHIEDIGDPALHFGDVNEWKEKLKSAKRKPLGGSQSCPVGGLLVVRYSQLPDKYFVVELVEINSNTVVYKKECLSKKQDSSKVALSAPAEKN